MIPGILPDLYSDASARWPRPGLAPPNCSCMAKRRRQLSSRMSRLARKSPKSIGFILVQMPPGERKSGIPHSVEMPAPVKGTTTAACSTSSRSRATPVSISGAIIAQGPPGVPVSTPAYSREQSRRGLRKRSAAASDRSIVPRAPKIKTQAKARPADAAAVSARGSRDGPSAARPQARRDPSAGQRQWRRRRER